MENTALLEFPVAVEIDGVQKIYLKPGVVELNILNTISIQTTAEFLAEAVRQKVTSLTPAVIQKIDERQLQPAL